jgi:hypothetical protein
MAFPLIGSGSGGFHPERAKAVILDELGKLDVPITVKVALFQKENWTNSASWMCR